MCVLRRLRLREFESLGFWFFFLISLIRTADPAWGAGCVACLRSLPMRDRARAMRPARYVGPAGKERF